MTIEKGRHWGEPGVLEDHGVVVHSDAEAARVVSEARGMGRRLPTLGLVGGDLCATLGGSGSEARLYTSEARRYPVDLGIAHLEGSEQVFVAHLIARRRLWQGPVFVAMNAQWLGSWDLGPKSHPNDGLLDITIAELPIMERIAARKRVPTGTHVPHPKIRVRRTARFETDFSRPTPVHLDGVRTGRVRHLVVEVLPDALTVVI